MTKNLMCNNSRAWQCWHSIGFSGPKLIELLVSAICTQLPKLDQFDEQFAAMVELTNIKAVQSSDGDWGKLREDEKKLKRQKANLLESIKEFGARPLLMNELDQIEEQSQDLLLRRHRLERTKRKGLVLPDSPSVLREMLEEDFRHLAFESPAFGTLMQKLVPEIYVYSVRLCNGGHCYPRAKVTLNLTGTFPDMNLILGSNDSLTQNLTLDLFVPPQRERIREESLRLAATGMKHSEIAKKIKEQPTATAVHNALKLQRQMSVLGLDSPYVVLIEPPEDYPKLRRYKHSRFSFKPLQGYERPEL